MVRYCCSQCQHADYTQHRQYCRELNRARKAMKPVVFTPNTNTPPPLTLPPPSVPLLALSARDIYYDSDYDDLPELEPNTNY